jgi:ABC-type branched-subunit amino acid transport system ATPase component
VKVDVDEIAVEYSGVRALNGASCTFTGGCVNGLIGPNGSGKSTMLNAISGAVRTASGRIRFDEGDVTGELSEKIRGRGVARTFQLPRLHPQISVLDNIALGVLPEASRDKSWSPWQASPVLRERRTAAAQWLERFGASGLASSMVGDLTLPQQRVVEFVRALGSRPRLVMFDEPSSGMDIDEAAEILRQGLKLLPEGATVILVSHDVDLVFEFAAWIVVMSEGRVLAQGDPNRIRVDERVGRVYLGA